MKRFNRILLLVAGFLVCGLLLWSSHHPGVKASPGETDTFSLEFGNTPINLAAASAPVGFIYRASETTTATQQSTSSGAWTLTTPSGLVTTGTTLPVDDPILSVTATVNGAPANSIDTFALVGASPTGATDEIVPGTLLTVPTDGSGNGSTTISLYSTACSPPVPTLAPRCRLPIAIPPGVRVVKPNANPAATPTSLGFPPF